MHDEAPVVNHLKQLKVSDDGSHHIFSDETPAYQQRFDEVLAFHAVNNETQAAPVYAQDKAWHISSTGDAIYPNRYDRTFGFYCDLAAVIDSGEWFHIGIDGLPAYPQRYAFAGNYQSDIAVVCGQHGDYFHIDKQGEAIYVSRWRYCGDFREGIAVVQANNGSSSHIDLNGVLLHEQWYDDLDVYHKGFARAKDKTGWHHIDKTGKSIYQQRYTSVEAFYNGCSRVETLDGAILVIDESGDILRTLRSAHVDGFAMLSADLVGYWRTFTVAAAVELGVFEQMPANTHELAKTTQTLPERLARLLRALAELGLVLCDDNGWKVSPKGVYLLPSNNMSLATAAMEYQGDLLQRWYQLAQIMKGEEPQSNIFQKVADDSIRVKNHHKMLSSYALKDYPNLISCLEIKPRDIVFDAAGGTGALAIMLEAAYPEAQIILGDLPEVIEGSQVKDKIEFDLFKPWPIGADKIILARVLHDWSDEHVRRILRRMADALKPNGEVYVFEMLLSNTRFEGSLCDLHLLCVTGGQERTQQQYEQLANEAGLHLKQSISKEGLVTVLSFTKEVSLD